MVASGKSKKKREEHNVGEFFPFLLLTTNASCVLKADLASSAGNSIGAFSGQNKRADMLSDGKWGVNGVCMTWRDPLSVPSL